MNTFVIYRESSVFRICYIFIQLILDLITSSKFQLK